MASLTEITKDLEELSMFLASSKRPNVKNHLMSQFNTLQKRKEELEKELMAKKNEEKPDEVDTTPIQSHSVDALRENFDTLKQYAWADGGSFIKVYVSLPGVGKMDKNTIHCKFAEDGFDLTIGEGTTSKRGHRLMLSPLDKRIKPAESKYVVKDDKVVVSLKKESKSDYWSDLKGKGEQKAKFDAGAASDPGAGIMDLMKNLYNDGDDEMKRTIAKAWTENQGKDPLSME